MTRSHFHAGQVFVALEIARTITRRPDTMQVTIEGGKKICGPVAIPVLGTVLTPKQRRSFERDTKCTEKVYVDGTGIWVGSTSTSQCRHALAIGRGLSRPIVCSTSNVCSRRYISRPIDEV